MADETGATGAGDSGPTDAETTGDTRAESSAAHADSRRRNALLALAGVAILLFGVGLGLLIHASLATDSDEDAPPAAGSAAVGFAQDMIAHHTQGIDMAALELYNGSDQQVRALAFDILTAQSNEIGQMQSWLTRWGYPLINPGDPMAWMGMGHGASSSMPAEHTGHEGSGHGGETHDHGDMPMPMPTTPAPSGATAEVPLMPGMATPSEMTQLRQARGTAADVLFLQLMLRHHEGGTHMMQYAANPANVDEAYVRDLASGMLRTQSSEIDRIKAMLAERNAQPLPMN
ncbi:DUF305 domain-containing protein [Gordonia sp. ABSL1-1]|uniref:DUF305 domain-containing protein n=1 Tax=Gordonia sp. ABSL1-1 TaxID=3053923 RepID=UPI002573BF9B|nr:DUF305 domain-containing protein [Gordonia sp. ABSL1-1]MDL9937047.1 DUF305 domain-containing protein [Gordonia sp. ABSL1-1]